MRRMPVGLKKFAAAEGSGRRIVVSQKWGSSDDVDLGRQIARNLEPDFLLAHLRLVPNLHGISSLGGERRVPRLRI
jgi:hypothetical protein